MFTSAWKQNYHDSPKTPDNVIRSEYEAALLCLRLSAERIKLSKLNYENKRNSNFFCLFFLILILFIVHLPPNRYENLKGKYYELKRAEMNGEQRPQWLYWKEMDYIVNQMPSHKLRTNLDHRITHLSRSSNNSTLNASTEQNRSTTSLPELRDTKPFRLSSMQSQDSMGESALLICLFFNFSLCLFSSHALAAGQREIFKEYKTNRFYFIKFLFRFSCIFAYKVKCFMSCVQSLEQKKKCLFIYFLAKIGG